MAKYVVIIGGGPGGNQAATLAARLGAEVTVVERDIIGGAAHLWDCIPSKAMIATGEALTSLGRIQRMGLTASASEVDPEALRDRIRRIEDRLQTSVTGLLDSQDVRMIRGTGRLTGPHSVVADTDDGPIELEADVVV
ncbi:MAG: FAD-dependent oxidoreductase, partial [Acidimicrobiia bacterium]|nr:FAD-dependent oxidoreductase [Acidimicrobiia bacterium]